MRSLSIIALGLAGAIVVTISTSVGQSFSPVKIVWDPNPEQDLAGYRVYYGQNVRSLTNKLEVGKTPSADLSLANGSRWYICVTAYNLKGVESGYSPIVSVSNSVSWPLQPSGLGVESL